MRPATAYSALWATAFAAVLVSGATAFSHMQAGNGAMDTLSPGQIQQRVAGAAAPAPAPPAAPAEPVLPPADGDRPSPRPIGGPGTAPEKKSPDEKTSPSPSPSPTAQTRTFRASGGSATATCRGDSAFLDSWAAAFGFFTENVLRGPAQEVGVRFDKLDFGAPDVLLLVKCDNGAPRASESFVRDGDTSGGGEDDDGPGNGRGNGRGED